MQEIQAVIFDWGDTLMRDIPEFDGPMAYWPFIEVLPGVAEVLATVFGRYTCCVASNAGDSDALLMALALERAGIRSYFQYFFTSRELGATKPDPEFFAAVSRRVNISPQYCLSVGNDYTKDIVPAKQLGMKTVLLSKPVMPPTCYPDADYVIAAINELPSILNGLEAQVSQ